MSAYVTQISDNEEARVNALRDLRLLDTPPSESFDRLTRLASRLLNAPVSTISLTDSDRQWFKSKVGVDLVEIPREQAPCSYAIQGDNVFVVPDLLEDARFATSPLAQAGIRFYAGAPLFTRAGHGLGTICVVDVAPRALGDEERQVLKDLAGMVMTQVDLQNMIGRVDATSGFANQHQMFEELAEIAGRAPGEPVLGILVDLISSNQAGHGQRVMGADYTDALVRGALRRMQPQMGNSARLYHVGATRCAAIFPPEAVVEPDEMVERMRGVLAEPILCNGLPVTAAPAFGTYLFAAGEVAPRDVLRRLYNAAEDARHGSGGQAHYSPAHDLQHARRFMLVNDFKAALGAADQLSLAYQPRVQMATGACVSAEALMRWRHPDLGAISPAEFIPAVEQTALARPMTDWVVGEALRQVGAWAERGIDVKVSINASALNLDECDFAGRLMGAVSASGLAPESLELEFTESAVARDGSRVIEQLKALRGFGIEIAIDDFGTGYSNLSYLQQLPATVLKIDRAFVQRLDASERDRTLVRAMIAMAHDLGYRVVAEGIETEGVYDMLAGWGCDEGQGFLMARPMPAAEMARWLGEERQAAVRLRA